MHRRKQGTAILGCLLLLAGLGLPCRAGEVRDRLETAIQAHGGEAGLAPVDVIMSGDITIFWGSSSMEGEVTVRVQGAGKVRRDNLVKFRGNLMEFISAYNGESAWVQRWGKIYDYPTDNFETELAHRPDLLLRAAGAAHELKDLGEKEIEGVVCWGVEVTAQGESTRCFFDAGTNLLREMEYKAMENSGEGVPEEVTTRVEYLEWKPVEGRLYPHRLVLWKDGVKDSETSLRSIRQTGIADAVFDRPDEENDYPDFEEGAA